MISSMTGFGQAEAELDGIYYTVEIRTVNNRYLKICLRLPENAAFLEGEVEKLIRQHLCRGTVNCQLRMKNISGSALFDVDESAVREYISRLRRVAPANEPNISIDLASLLTLPGVVQPAVPDSTQAEKIRQVTLELVEKALEQLRQMRMREGRALSTDLMDNCKILAEKLELIRQRSPLVVKEYHEKLGKRVNELIAVAQLRMDTELLAKEVAIFAERSDIAEELTRLSSHLQQFQQSCTDDSNAGRKMEFIAQELLRETNTISSKASDALISRCVIDMKCIIDRLKEQIQNVE